MSPPRFSSLEKKSKGDVASLKRLLFYEMETRCRDRIDEEETCVGVVVVFFFLRTKYDYSGGCVMFGCWRIFVRDGIQ
jgi:hypothetical protein